MILMCAVDNGSGGGDGGRTGDWLAIETNMSHIKVRTFNDFIENWRKRERAKRKYQ